MTELGRLTKVDLRAVWTSESGSFTPWLAQEDSLSLLADAIGLEFELESTEKNVGPFRADIVCRELTTDSLVLIENQLEGTDHKHLGQLLTYAAGLDAVAIVWIAESFTEEHRAAMDWLNEITDREINFFGLEVELWRIGDSDVAPKFNIISQPNDWKRNIAAIQRDAVELTPTKEMQLQYWTEFREHLRSSGSFIQSRKPRPQHWMYFAIGRSKFRLCTFANTRDHRIGVRLETYGPNAKPHFYLLREDREEIEAEMGQPLEWRESSKYGIVSLRNHQTDPTNWDDWTRQHEWLRHALERMHEVFAPRVAQLDADDYLSDDVDDLDWGK